MTSVKVLNESKAGTVLLSEHQHSPKNKTIPTDQIKLPCGEWSSTMGFSRKWKALRMVLVVLVPYVTVTVRGSDGTLSARYSPVLQVISVPKVSLPGKRTPLNCCLAGEGGEGGMVGMEGGGGRLLGVTVQWEPTRQRHDSLLNPSFTVSVAHYFSITST